MIRRSHDARHGNGTRAIDPTDNVLALVQAAVKSQSDLREADNRYYDMALKEHHRNDEASHAHLKEMAGLRAEYSKDVRASDQKAAEKTREVDVLAGGASAKALADAVSQLQATTDRNAETLRIQVNANATTLAKQVSDAAVATQLQTDNLFRRLDERLIVLERGAATGAGRQSVADPQTERLMHQMEVFMAAQAKSTGKDEGVSKSGAIALGAVTLISVLMGIGSFIYSANRPPVAAQASSLSPTVPQVIYQLAPGTVVVPPAAVK